MRRLYRQPILLESWFGGGSVVHPRKAVALGSSPTSLFVLPPEPDIRPRKVSRLMPTQHIRVTLSIHLAVTIRCSPISPENLYKTSFSVAVSSETGVNGLVISPCVWTPKRQTWKMSATFECDGKVIPHLQTRGVLLARFYHRDHRGPEYNDYSQSI